LPGLLQNLQLLSIEGKLPDFSLSFRQKKSAFARIAISEAAVCEGLELSGNPTTLPRRSYPRQRETLTTGYSSKDQGDDEENRSSDNNAKAEESGFVRAFQVAGSSTTAR
jgi:hypothetical protein